MSIQELKDKSEVEELKNEIVYILNQIKNTKITSNMFPSVKNTYEFISLLKKL